MNTNYQIKLRTSYFLINILLKTKIQILNSEIRNKNDLLIIKEKESV